LEIKSQARHESNRQGAWQCNIYASPGASLEFVDTVGAVGAVYHKRHPDDPSRLPESSQSTTRRLEQVSSLTLPVGTHKIPQAVAAIVDPPPFGENPSSLLAGSVTQKADLISPRLHQFDRAIQSQRRWHEFLRGPDVSSDRYQLTRSSIRTLPIFDYRENKQVSPRRLMLESSTVGCRRTPSQITHQLKRGFLNSIYVNDQLPPPAKTHRRARHQRKPLPVPGDCRYAPPALRQRTFQRD